MIMCNYLLKYTKYKIKSLADMIINFVDPKDFYILNIIVNINNNDLYS